MTGKPRSGDQVRDRLFSVRLTPAEYEEIKEYAASHGITMTQALILGIRELEKQDSNE